MSYKKNRLSPEAKLNLRIKESKDKARFGKQGWNHKTTDDCFQTYSNDRVIGYAFGSSWKKRKSYKKIVSNFLDILPHEISIPLFSFALLSVLTTPLKILEADFPCLLSLSGGTKEDRELVALYYCDVVKRGKSWSTKKLPKRHSSSDSKEQLQKKTKEMKDCVLILSGYDTAKQVSMIRNIYEQSSRSDCPNGVGLLLQKNKPKNRDIYNIDISNVDLSKLKKRVEITKKITLNDYLYDFVYMLITEVVCQFHGVCKKLKEERKEILNRYEGRIFQLDMRSIRTFQYLMLAYTLLLKLGWWQDTISDEELLELQDYAADIFFAGLQDREAKPKPVEKKEPIAKQEPQRTPIQKLFDCLDKHFAEDNGTMRKTKLAKPENPDKIEMWYDDECLYISQEKIKDILKQNNMVTDLFDKVKEELKKKELINTGSKKDGTVEYSVKIPKRFNEEKSQKRAVSFYRGICRAQGYFCKTLAKLESMTENA